MKVSEFLLMLAKDLLEMPFDYFRHEGSPSIKNVQLGTTFEEKTGITGIAGHYTFPEDFNVNYPWKHLNSRMPENAEKEEVLDTLNSIAQEFIRLNPKLKSVRFDNTDVNNVLNFLAGVWSEVNPDDMDYFLNTTEDERNNSETNARQDRLEQVLIERECNNRLEAYLERKFGQGFIDWKASEATLDKIEAQLTREVPVDSKELADSPVVPSGADPIVYPERAVEGKHTKELVTSGAREREF